MDTRDTSAITRLGRAPLALCLGTALAVGSTCAGAADAPRLPIPLRSGEVLPAHRLPNAVIGPRLHHDTPHPDGGIVIPVTSCADDGSDGTLRHAVLVASTGDTVDLTALTCSTITLESGAISVDVDDLDIVGPGADALAIDGVYADRVIRHGGVGELSISSVTLTHGSYTTPATPTDLRGGGCLYSAGDLSLFGVVVSDCALSGDTYIVGGGVLALGNVVMFNSTVRHSSAVALVGGTPSSAVGGGVVAVGQLVFEHSTMSGNLASTAAGNAYAGGG
ncbi:MAG TPA: hypothetical protein VKB52_10120, partial [Rhodanobacteraceae bacterium]|nr:hypothetical protein [Rhodanobacteraceae bacterium]